MASDISTHENLKYQSSVVSKTHGRVEKATFSSLLSQSDCQIHLRPTLNPPNLEEYLSAVQVAQVPSQINKYRIYLSVARALNYTISDEITKVRILSVYGDLFAEFRSAYFSSNFCHKKRRYGKSSMLI